MPLDSTRTYRVAIIGAGPGGICAAVRLRQAGIEDFVVLEQAEGIGGTWSRNRYPGLACDVASHFYSFSFAPKPDWSRPFAGQAEILAYLEEVVAAFGIRAPRPTGHQRGGRPLGLRDGPLAPDHRPREHGDRGDRRRRPRDVRRAPVPRHRGDGPLQWRVVPHRLLARRALALRRAGRHRRQRRQRSSTASRGSQRRTAGAPLPAQREPGPAQGGHAVHRRAARALQAVPGLGRRAAAAYNQQLQLDIEHVDVWQGGCSTYYRVPVGTHRHPMAALDGPGTES